MRRRCTRTSPQHPCVVPCRFLHRQTGFFFILGVIQVIFVQCNEPTMSGTKMFLVIALERFVSEHCQQHVFNSAVLETSAKRSTARAFQQKPNQGYEKAAENEYRRQRAAMMNSSARCSRNLQSIHERLCFLHCVITIAHICPTSSDSHSLNYVWMPAFFLTCLKNCYMPSW